MTRPPARARAAPSAAPDPPGDAAAERDDGVDVHLAPDGTPRMVERRFVVEEAFAGQRLDHYLKRKIPRLSRTKLQEIIRTQLAPVRGRRLKPHSAVAIGDEIVIRRPARPEPACPRRFGVLYEDPHMLVIDKPAGLPVHASAKFYFNTLTRVLSERYPDGHVQICHRLDRETSGALVVARDKLSAARLKGAFARRVVKKAYLAVVAGRPPWPGDDSSRDLDQAVAAALLAALDDRKSGGAAVAGDVRDHVIDLPLGLVQDPAALISIRMVARGDAQPARTRVRVLARREHCALVLCVPITGRQHQIRAHLAACGHPIVGDKLYRHGDEAFAAYCDHGMTAELLARFELPRHALHAAAIAVPHPASGLPIRVLSRLPSDLRSYLDRPAR